MDADREARRAVVGEHPLPRVCSGSGGVSAVGSSGSASWRSSPSRDALRARDEPELPEQRARWPAEAVAGAARDERLERASASAVRCASSRTPRNGPAALPLRDERLRVVLADRRDVLEPDPHGAVLDLAERALTG